MRFSRTNIQDVNCTVVISVVEYARVVCVNSCVLQQQCKSAAVGLTGSASEVVGVCISLMKRLIYVG